MKVVCEVRRQRPGEPPYWARYDVDIPEGSTLLDLVRSMAKQDPGLVFTPHHCKVGICGGCRLLVNGRRRLACRSIVQPGVLRLEPAPGLPVIQDLLVDLLALHGKDRSARGERRRLNGAV